MGTPAYDRQNTRRINLKLNNKTDDDIIQWLNAMKQTEGIQGYLKRLIREDIKRNPPLKVVAAKMTADEAAEFERKYGNSVLIKRIERGAKAMTYKIKPECLDLWGEDATEETVLTEDDIEMIARGWDKKPEDVMDQLIPQE